MPEPALSSFAVVTAQEMRALERAAAAAGLTEAQLQERAAEEIAQVAASEAGAPGRAPIVGVIGPGNNGRDAMLAGRNLARAGYQVRLYLGPRHAVAESEFQELAGLGVIWQHHAAEHLQQLSTWLREAIVVLDGLLGIGVRGPMRAPLADIAETVNAARAERGTALRVVSVDLPSGLDSDTGEAPGVVVRADVTVALGAVKAGTLRFPGASFAGRIEPRPIGLPPGLDEGLPVRLLDYRQAARLVPPRPLDAHKGTFGSLLVVGGSREYLGAPILAALGAARAGCGLVALGVPARVQAAAAARLPEATYVLLPGDGAASDPEGSAQALREAWPRFDALVLGPGLGRSPGAEALARQLVSGALGEPRPVVVDADALTLLARWPAWWTRTSCPLVLTPHYGEMARLCDRAPAELAGASWEAARAKAREWHQVVVLKGPFTVVAEPEGLAWVSPWANPALASAGSGDVLAGLIGGFLAQGLDRGAACRLAVAVQAHAASAIVARGRRTLLASEVAEQVPATLDQLARGERG